MSAQIHVPKPVYAPGEVLRGRVELTPPPDEVSRRVELTVLWETEGKGDTDVGVVLHRVLADGDPAAATAAHEFAVVLPPLPLTYFGNLVKIGWHVRVRRLAPLGDDAVIDLPFRLAWPR